MFTPGLEKAGWRSVAPVSGAGVAAETEGARAPSCAGRPASRLSFEQGFVWPRRNR